MEDAITTPVDPKLATAEVPVLTNRRMETKRMAWMVITAAFVGFCLMCVTVSFGIYFFLFQSTVNLTATVRVADPGTVGLVSENLIQRFEYDTDLVNRGDTIFTDSQSNSIVTFEDPQVGVVASITMKSDATLRVESMTQSRFEWGAASYGVALSDVEGEFDVFIPDRLPRAVNVVVLLPDGAFVHMAESGSYTLAKTDDGLLAEVRRGQAAIAPANGDNRSIREGERGQYHFLDGTITIGTGFEDLIVNNIFNQPAVDFDQMRSDGTSEFELWNCNDRTYADMKAALEWTIFEGRLALHILRGGTRAHGETGCIQPLGSSAQDGRYVGDYNFLSLRTTFLIKHHSLNDCGVQGSECPLMLKLDYIDTDGDRNSWLQGFYARHDPNVDNPLRCNGALCEQHIRINSQAWYSYESGNLFSLLPDDQPESILNVQFYASGHEYDIYVSELSLLAGNQPIEQSVVAVPQAGN